MDLCDQGQSGLDSELQDRLKKLQRNPVSKKQQQQQNLTNNRHKLNLREKSYKPIRDINSHLETSPTLHTPMTQTDKLSHAVLS